LYGCETRSLTSRKEGARLGAFENRMLREIFGSEKEEVRGDWRQLHNEELRDLCCSPDIIRVTTSRGVIQMGSDKYGKEICVQDFGGET